MKIMILDPHTLFRAGLISLLKDQAEIDIVGDGSLGSDTVDQIRFFQPEIVIMGGDLYELDGREMMSQVLATQPEIAFLILVFDENAELLLDVIRNGAKGYLPMDVSEAALVKSLYAMWRGEVAISRSMTSKVVDEFYRVTRIMHGNNHQEADFLMLTAREEDVLHLLADDASNQEIADKLFISGNTVRIHVRSILKKLNLRNRREVGEFMRRMSIE